MAMRAPTYDGLRAAPGGPVGVRVPGGVDNAAAPVAAGAARAADAIGDEVARQRAQFEDVAVLGASSALTDYTTRVMSGPDGLLNLRGPAAFERAGKLLGEWDKEAGRAAGKLPSERARLAFAARTAALRSRVNEQTQQYVAGQLVAADNDATEGALATLRASAGAAPLALLPDGGLDGRLLDADLAEMDAALDGWGARRGVDAGLVAERKREARAAALGDAWQGVLAMDDPDLARAFLDRYGPAMAKPTVAAGRQALRVKDAARAENAAYGALISEVMSPLLAGEDGAALGLTERETLARERLDAVVPEEAREAVGRRLDAFFADERRLERQRYEGDREAFARLMEEGGLSVAAAAERMPDFWAKAETADRKALTNFEANRAEGKYLAESDHATREAAADILNGKDVDPWRLYLARKIGAGQRDELLGLIKERADTGGAAGPKIEQLRTKVGVVTPYIEQLYGEDGAFARGLDDADKAREEREFWRAVDQVSASQQRALKRDLTVDEWEAIAKKLAGDRVLKVLADGDTAEIALVDVSSRFGMDAVSRAADALRARGSAVTEPAINEWLEDSAELERIEAELRALGQ